MAPIFRLPPGEFCRTLTILRQIPEGRAVAFGLKFRQLCFRYSRFQHSLG